MSQFDINKAKARIAGFTTSLNNKITGAENLVDQVLGPPILKSETVRAQLNQRLDEVQEAWAKLKALLDKVVDYYIENPADDSAGAHRGRRFQYRAVNVLSIAKTDLPI